MSPYGIPAQPALSTFGAVKMTTAGRNPTKNWFPVNCAYCGKEYLIWPSEYKRGKGKYCSRECRDLNNRGDIYFYASKKKYNLNHPERYRAHKLVDAAIKLGRVSKTNCELCGVEKVEAHHEDYSKPLEIRWLCHKHHMKRHAEIRAATHEQ
jgi:hypothetical protein